MDTKTPIKLEGARLARVSAAGALCALAVISSLAPRLAHADAASRAAATLLYTRITGVPPDAAMLNAMEPLIATNVQGAAAMATAAPQFYNVTLKNMFLPATNRDQSVFVPLN